MELAQRLAPAALLNADSRQALRGLRVGTCAPTPEELRGVRCHLLEICAPGQRFTAHDWQHRHLSPSVIAAKAQRRQAASCRRTFP